MGSLIAAFWDIDGPTMVVPDVIEKCANFTL